MPYDVKRRNALHRVKEIIGDAPNVKIDCERRIIEFEGNEGSVIVRYIPPYTPKAEILRSIRGFIKNEERIRSIIEEGAKPRLF